MAKPGPRKGSRHCKDWIRTGKKTPKLGKEQKICAKYVKGKRTKGSKVRIRKSTGSWVMKRMGPGGNLTKAARKFLHKA